MVTIYLRISIAYFPMKYIFKLYIYFKSFYHTGSLIQVSLSMLTSHTYLDNYRIDYLELLYNTPKFKY